MRTVLLVLFGIVLPAAALAVELANGMCAETFFDPIPTWGHALLVAWVPVANLLALLAAGRGWMRWRTPLLWGNGIALGIALIYTLVFLPLTPPALIGIVFFGLGLLPLAPLSALLCGIALRRRLAHMPMADGGAPTWSMTSLLGGVVVGILLLAATESRIALTSIGAEMATAESPDRQIQGIRLLRRFSNRDELLRMCYGEATRRNGPFGPMGSRSLSGYLFDSVGPEDAQRIFFRVTGEPYNATPPPRTVSPWAVTDFDFDPDIGGQAVAGRRKGLLLASSRIDARIFADAAVAYTEWTMTFRNDHQWQQQEARAQILLPPGGVVSRVTLWVNGEPCEAAFAGAADVRKAYRKVAVAQRRDPLLVTWAGNDRALVQCFPVPPRGEMKIRIGITSPLTLEDTKTAWLRLPCFAERNFGVATKDVHSLWVESDRPCQRSDKTADANKVVRGTLTDAELASDGSTILVDRSTAMVESWTPDKKDPKQYILQKVVARRSPAKRNIAVVIDGSRGMADHFDAIAKALAAMPDLKPRVLLAADEIVDLSGKDAAKQLHALAGVGGCDNVPALLQAFDEVGDGGAIVWLHGPQPVMLRPATPLVQWLERGAKVDIYDVAMATGANRLAGELGTVAGLRTVPYTSAVPDGLKGLFTRLAGQTNEYRLERIRIEGAPPAGPKASSHLARLWAAGRVTALARTGKPADRKEAVNMAAAYQLVTPVSGAVVLENQQQYKDSNLQPADPESVPNLPEPATWILLLTGVPWLLWMIWRRRVNRGLESPVDL